MKTNALAVFALVLAFACAPWAHARDALPPFPAAAVRAQMGADPEGARRAALPYLAEDAGVSPADAKVAARIVAITYALQGNYEAAVATAQHAFDRAKAGGDTREMGVIKSNMGGFYTRMGKLREAVAALREASALASSTGDTNTWAMALGNLSILMQTYNNMGAALDLSLQQEAALRRAGKPVPPLALLDRAEVYAHLGQITKAEATLAEAEAGLPATDLTHQASAAYVHALIAKARKSPARTAQAAARCEELLATAKVDTQQAFSCIALRAGAAASLGDQTLAEAKLAQLKALLAATPRQPAPLYDTRKLDATEAQAEVARAAGHYDDAFRALQSALDQYREVSTAREESGIALAMAEFDTQSKKQQIQLLEQTNRVLAVQSQQRMIIAVGAIGGLALAVAALLLAIRGARTQHLLNRALQEITAQKETRLREEQHRAKNNLQMILGLLNAELPADRDDASIDQARERELILGLRSKIEAICGVQERLADPGQGQDIELATFVSDLVLQIEQSYPPSARLAVSFDMCEVSVPPRAAMQIGLMIAEMIANAHKHAKGSALKVASAWSPDARTLHLKVEDSGGAPAGKRSARGLGFSIIKDLAEQLGGRAEFGLATRGSAWSVAIPAPQPNRLPVSALL